MKKSGFTLLEILLVVGIIAILAGIVIVALNPTKQFSAVRNTQRKANLNEIHKALYQYYIDNSRYPITVPIINLGEICNTGASSTPTGINCTGLVDLSPLVPTYLTAIPTDPQATGTSTLYSVAKNAANKIYVKALNAELSQTVTLGPSEGILPDHLVSYWSFDGNANDSWGTNNGTCTGGTCPTLTTGVKGLVNTAYSFDGVDDWISCGVPISSSFSYSFWLNQRNLQYWTGLIDGTDLQSVVYTYDFIHWAKSSGLYLDGSSFSLNTWHHFVLTYNISTNVIEIFKDGVFNVNTTPNYPTSSFSIQKLGRVSSYYLNGILDNVRVYNKALTTDEIQMIYNVEKP